MTSSKPTKLAGQRLQPGRFGRAHGSQHNDSQNSEARDNDTDGSTNEGPYKFAEGRRSAALARSRRCLLWVT